MAYSSEVVRAARKVLADRKADRASRYRENLQVAYEKLPRLREIDRLLRATMAAAAQAAFVRGGDSAALMEQARAKNFALQQEKETLIAENFPEGFLEEGPICRKCGGEGYIGTEMCDCLKELCRAEQRKQVRVLSANAESFEDFNLNYYSDRVDPKYGASPRVIMKHNFDICRKYAGDFSMKSGNLLFIGGTGLGKTFLSACVAAEAADKGYSVAYETASHLFAKLEKNRFSPDEESREEVRKLESSDLLIVDDLGTELPGSFVTAALYTLVNDRLLAGKPMVISTNLNIDEIARRYNPQIASRLQGSFTRLTFVGEDIRVLKNR